MCEAMPCSVASLIQQDPITRFFIIYVKKMSKNTCLIKMY